MDKPDEGTVMTASAEVMSRHALSLDVPRLRWEVLVRGCGFQERIKLADAITNPLKVRPGKNFTVGFSSTISSLPRDLLDPCTDETPSPLETLFQDILDPNKTASVFVSGKHAPPNIPNWISRLLSSVTLPIPLPHLTPNTSELVSGIHCSEMKFAFPSPWAPPGSPQSKLRVSALIEVVINPPPGTENFNINVTAVRADVFLLDERKKFGRVVVPVWSPATTFRTTKIHITARVIEVPVEVLDPALFQKVMGKVLYGGNAEIGVDGTVDAQVSVLMGDFQIRGIPVQAVVEVQGTHPLDDLKMRLDGDINVVYTTTRSIVLQSTVGVTNPTEYEAFVPYLNLNLLYKGYRYHYIKFTIDVSLETPLHLMRVYRKE